jgi:ADP-ribosylglycohydrolase
MVHTLVGLAIGDALGTPFETQHFTSGILTTWSGEYLGSDLTLPANRG